MNKSVITVLLTLSVALGGALLHFKGKRYEVVITQEKIDAALSQKFPATKKHLVIFSITYSDPQVTLLEKENRVQVGLDATINIRIDDEPRNLKGGATITSAIRYDSNTQEFFLDDATFDRLDIQGIPEKWRKQVMDLATIAAREFIETKPIYRIEAKDGKTTAAKLFLKDFEVRGQAIHISLGI